MPDEVAAAATYAAKLNPEIIKSRLSSQGAIIAVNYGNAADELTGYESALKDSLATVTPAPSVTEVRYLQEYQRETARALKKYGGGVAVREAAAIARLWCRFEFGAPAGRGLKYSTLQKVAYDLFGITLPSPSPYIFSGFYAWFDWNTETGGFNLVAGNKKCMSKWDYTYGQEQYYRAWVRTIAPEAHWGTSRPLWLRFTPGALKLESPDFVYLSLWAIKVAYLHPAGLVDTQDCYASLLENQNYGVGDKFETLDPGVNTFALGTTEIGADGGIEVVFYGDDADYADVTYEDSFDPSATVEILYDDPEA